MHHPLLRMCDFSSTLSRASCARASLTVLCMCHVGTAGLQGVFCMQASTMGALPNSAGATRAERARHSQSRAAEQHVAPLPSPHLPTCAHPLAVIIHRVILARLQAPLHLFSRDSMLPHVVHVENVGAGKAPARRPHSHAAPRLCCNTRHAGAPQSARDNPYTGTPECTLCLILAMALPGLRPCKGDSQSLPALPSNWVPHRRTIAIACYVAPWGRPQCSS